MNRNEVVGYGIKDPEGRLLWANIVSRNLSFHEVLTEMRREQELLAAYSKGLQKTDDNQVLMLRRIRLLETFAWRMYMFGSEPMGIYPGRMGELRKQQRNDPAYWKYLSQSNIRHGTVGCEQLNNLFRKAKRPCSRVQCSHEGQRHADKWLKSQMRTFWERSILRRYMY